MLKKNVIVAFIVTLIICSSSLAIWRVNNKPNEEEKMQEKINEEINYLSKELINIANKLNNISIEEYTVSEEETKKSEGESSNSSSSNSTSSGEKENSGSSNESNKNKTISLYKIKNNMDNTEEVNWEDIENEINIIYSTWPQIVIDLYKTSVNGEDILSFEKNIDETYKYIKNKDKNNSLVLIANLYSYIPKFVNGYSQSDIRKVNLEKAKSNILSSYALIEKEKWDDIYNEIKNAEDNFNNILNDIDNNKNQYNYNKVYILLKEYQNSIETKDKNIIYFRYKKVIQEMINTL